MMHPARTTSAKGCVGGKSESVTKARADMGIGVLDPRQIGNSEKPSAQTSSLISQLSASLHRDVGPRLREHF